MKAAAVFALRIFALTLALIVVFTIASNLAGLTRIPLPSTPAASTPTAPAQQAASLLTPLLVYASLVSLVIAWIIQRSRGRGFKLIAVLAFSFYGVMTFIIQIESIVYLYAKVPPGLIKDLFVMGAIVAVLFVPLAVLIMGRLRGPGQPQDAHALPLKNLAVRFAVLAIVYVVLYYLFGYYVAWQNPDLRLYYAGNAELKSFYQMMRSTEMRTPWMLPFQFVRGLLWSLFAYPVVRMLNARRIETAGIIAALFGVGSFALLIPNPLMPASVAHSHLWETLLSDLLLGAIVGWVLADAKATGQSQTQVG